jgi:hypothetical protein
MRVKWRWSAAFVAVGTGLVLASCSEPTTTSAPVRPTSGRAAPNVVGSFSAPAGALQLTINSGDAAVHFCGYDSNVIPSLTPFPGADCATTAFDLTTALQSYVPGHPGWTAPYPGTAWIGPTTLQDAPSNEYRARVGTYEYVTSFNIPAGATNVTLQLTAKSDNALVAYLNGTEIGQNAFLEDCTLEQGAFCNWVVGLNIDNVGASFNVGGTNTLVIAVVNTRIGYEVGGAGHTARSTCEIGPDPLGAAGFGGAAVSTFAGHILANWLASQCQNPTGLDFQAKIFFTPALPIPLFVIGDVEPHAVGDVVNFWGAQWWKNNTMSGVTDPGYESFKGYASSADNVCGGQWSTQPGNSSDPPATIPTNVAIIVTTKVLKNGNVISGDIKQILLVHQDGNYDDNPGHAGGGPVIQVLCTRQ